MMDYGSKSSVPFEIPDVNYGFKTVKGLLKLRDKGLELEYETTDSFFGVMKSGVKTILLPFENLEKIEFDKKWFSGMVIIEGHSMKDFEDVPGSDRARCELKIKRKNRKEAENLVSKARAMLSEYKLSKLDEE